MKKIISEMKKNVMVNQQIYTFFIIAMGIIGFLVVMYKADLGVKILPYASHKSNRDEVQMVHDFISGMEIQQKFKCYSDFDFITLSFSDHDQRLLGKLEILIKEVDTGNIVCYEEKDMTSVRYNVPVKISFAEIGGGKADKVYEIHLSAEDTETVALGVFGYKAEEEPAIVNGEKSEYALSVGIHSYTSFYYVFAIIILGLSIITVFCVTICTFKFTLKEENMFLLMAIPFVIGMLILWPGNAVYDEARHYHTVYFYSNAFLGKGFEDSYTQIQMRKCDVVDDKELEELNTSINAQAQKCYYYYQKMWEKIEEKENIVVDISDMPVVADGTFVQYMPGIIGASIGRVLGCNHFWMMTIIRMVIVGFYLLMCYYAIYKIPVLKIMVTMIAALPMNLYQASGISYDSVTFAVGIVVFAFIIKLWYSGLEKKEWFILGSFVFLLGKCKGGVYLTLILLMIFIPKKRYIQKKWLKFLGILMLAGISMLSSFLPTIMAWINMSLARSGGTEAPTIVINSGGLVAQKLSPMLVVSNPQEFVRLFIQTMIENLDIYFGQMLGYRTAWSNEPIEFVVLLPFLILIILASVNKEEESFKVGIIGKIGIFFILLFELMGMQAIFLAETPIHYSTIIGFQGRYFILFLPCILLLFRNESLIYKGKIETVYPMFSMAQLIYWYFFLKMFMVY